MAEGQHRTGSSTRLIALLDQIDMTLKNVVFLLMPNPPDPVSHLDRMAGVGMLQIIEGMQGMTVSSSKLVGGSFLWAA